MRRTPTSKGSLDGRMMRALNKIKRPSTAEEITDLVNGELDSGDRAFPTKQIEEWLRNAQDTALTLYWIRTRPRR
jgi:hypothetical protein